jgi:hypothetical protein
MLPINAALSFAQAKRQTPPGININEWRNRVSLQSTGGNVTKP